MLSRHSSIFSRRFLNLQIATFSKTPTNIDLNDPKKFGNMPIPMGRAKEHIREKLGADSSVSVDTEVVALMKKKRRDMLMAEYGFKSDKPRIEQSFKELFRGSRRDTEMLRPKNLIIACSILLFILFVFEYARDRRSEATRSATNVSTIGKPKLGGPFTLYDCRTGMAVNSDDLRGKYLLIYFGFSFCPDICPIELQKIVRATRDVNEHFQKNSNKVEVIPIFISVDPARDTLAQIATYCDEFSEKGAKLEGLVGTPEQVKAITRQFRVYFNQGIKTDIDDDYLVDHSIITYFMGKDGKFVDFFARSATARDIAKGLKDKITIDNRELAKKKYGVFASMALNTRAA